MLLETAKAFKVSKNLLAWCLVFLIYFLFASEAWAGSFSIQSPTAGSCYSPTQIINIQWTSSSIPTVKQYAVTYRTDGTTPPSYSTSPSAWTIGNKLSSTSTTWVVPGIGSSSVRIWIEAEKQNNDQVDLVSSGIFSIKSSCAASNSTPPKPGGTVTPPPPSTLVTGPLTPTLTSSSSASRSAAVSSPPSVKQKTVAKTTEVKANYTGLILYLLLLIILVGGGTFLYLKREQILNYINQVRYRQPANEPMVNVKAPPAARPKELTVDQLENLRRETEAIEPPPEPEPPKGV